jgi:16S rRNA (guanine(966)-N(2))-methyltransferase RsmD
MRIISGKFKSRRFKAPKQLPVRPTTDRAKEALFNILGHQYFLDELKVLDLFAGIGSITFEFASRGTKDLTAVDQHKGCIDFINKTSDELDIAVNVINTDVLKFLEQTSQAYDIIFADPPYAWTNEELTQLIDLIFENKHLNPNGLFILEHSKHTDVTSHPKYVQNRKYGLSVFSWFE